MSWMCKKQTSVSHCSTESEIISLDAGLRSDGIPALDLWDLIVSGLGNTIQTPERPGRPVVKDKDQRSQGICKEYTSYYRKLATETIQIQHEERQEH